MGIPDDAIPATQFVLGVASARQLWGLTIPTFDSGQQLVIHSRAFGAGRLALDHDVRISLARDP